MRKQSSPPAPGQRRKPAVMVGAVLGLAAIIIGMAILLQPKPFTVVLFNLDPGQDLAARHLLASLPASPDMAKIRLLSVQGHESLPATFDLAIIGAGLAAENNAGAFTALPQTIASRYTDSFLLWRTAAGQSWAVPLYFDFFALASSRSPGAADTSAMFQSNPSLEALAEWIHKNPAQALHLAGLETGQFDGMVSSLLLARGSSAYARSLQAIRQAPKRASEQLAAFLNSPLAPPYTDNRSYLEACFKAQSMVQEAWFITDTAQIAANLDQGTIATFTLWLSTYRSLPSTLLDDFSVNGIPFSQTSPDYPVLAPAMLMALPSKTNHPEQAAELAHALSDPDFLATHARACKLVPAPARSANADIQARLVRSAILGSSALANGIGRDAFDSTESARLFLEELRASLMYSNQQ